VIALAVRWYLRYGLSYRDVEACVPQLPVVRGRCAGLKVQVMALRPGGNGEIA
jgi:hypothetical protein